MHILMISPVPIHPTNTGGKVRIWHIAKGLAQHFNITFVVPYEEQISKSEAFDLNTYSANSNNRNLEIIAVPWTAPNPLKRLRSLFSSWPYHVALCYRENIFQVIQTLKYDAHYSLIYGHFIYTLPYIYDSPRPVILDQHNVDRIYWQRQVEFHRQNPLLSGIMRWNLAKTIRFENKMLPHLSGIVSVSDSDRAETRQYASSWLSNFLVAPNGVDIEQYRFRRREEDDVGSLVLGFLGSMHLSANQDAALTLMQKILPDVQRQLPNKKVSLLIIGRNPSRKLLDLADQQKEHQITVTGTVPDILPYLHQVDILVLPLQSGAGTKLRVLEAMSAGVPVVGSPIALAGLDGMVLRQHALLAKNQAEFVTSICQLASNTHQRHQIAEQARQLVTERYSWAQITSTLAEQIKLVYGKSREPDKQNN